MKKFPCERFTTGTIRGRIYSPPEGADTTVILCHGLNSSMNHTAVYGKHLAAKGYRAAVFDFNVKEMSLLTEKKELSQVTSFVKEKYGGEIIYFGESQGGAVALWEAASRDDIPALFLFFPAVNIPDMIREKYRPPFPRKTIFLDAPIRKNYIEDIYDLDLYRTFYNASSDFYIAAGRKDPLVPPKLFLKKGIKNKLTDFIILSDEGHGFGKKAALYCLDRFIRIYEDH